MEFREYVDGCKRTESRLTEINDETTLRRIHAVMGISTEAAELVDQMKKSVFYKKPLDTRNIYEELGDLMWYVAILCDTCGFNLDDIMQSNLDKLKARYGEKFTTEAAVNRNIENEMDALNYKSA